jgi:hypothetical protein
MSKPIPTDQPIVHRAPDAQIKYFTELYRHAVNPVKLVWFKARVRGLGLHFTDEELTVLAALDQPDKVQEFLNTQIYYNNDHASVELEETAMPPRGVLQTGLAHCFEGALFAYAVNYLHGYAPRLVVIEASQDSEHNLVVWRDPRTNLYGCNAHSAFPHLDGRAAQFPTIHALVESYVPYYYSDRTHDPGDLTIVGYSDEFDLVAKFGVEWLAADAPLWNIYYTYIDDTWRFHYLNDDSATTHLYPVIRALKEKWIEIDAQSKPFVNADNLPRDAQVLWHTFWKLHGDNQTYRRPRGEEAEIEKKFMRLTGTTPIDLDDNAFDLQFFLAAGYRIEQLLVWTQANADKHG